MSRVWLQKVSVPTRKHAICRGPLLPSCSRSRTEVMAPLHQLSTVLDVENHVLGVLRTPRARADSGNVSSFADSSKICSKVPGSLSIAGRDGIVSCTSSSAGGVNRHLQLLSGIVTHTNCHQGCHQHPCNKEPIFLPCTKVLGTSHARKSTRIVRASGSLHLTRRPPSCWRRAPLALWIPRSRNGILCPGYLIGHA